MRSTRTWVADVRAGCFTCHGGQAAWWSKNAMALAAQHHDRTGHPTWAEQFLSVRYGSEERVAP